MVDEVTRTLSSQFGELDYIYRHMAIPQIFDLIIVGGGINGAGIALEAALRGLSVVLVEKEDIGHATSTWNTRLIHGGLRYLEYFELSLVRESLRERERLLHNAPHLVQPMTFRLPLFEHSKRGPFLIKAGMVLYDLLSYDKTLQNHQMNYLTNTILKENPYLQTEGLRGLATYQDCQITWPERLCLELALTAKNHGATILTHSELTGLESAENESITIRVNDQISGTSDLLTGRYLVNAAGPWVDQVLGLVDERIPRKMGVTKGSHLVIKRFHGGPQDAFYMEAREDGRPFFLIPWRNYYLVGTTDIFFDGDLDDITVTELEIEYLLKELDFFFPAHDFTKDDILYTYSGVRPLPFEPEAKKASQVTRRHIIYEHSRAHGHRRMASIIGGKLTTYRSLAEETVDVVQKHLDLSVTNSPSRNFQLLGAENISNWPIYFEQKSRILANRYRISLPVAQHLIHFYGSRADVVMALTEDHHELAEQLHPDYPDIAAQIIYAVQNENARTLSDIMLRRTSLGTHAGLGLDCLDRVVQVAAPLLDWDASEQDRQKSLYKNWVGKHHLMTNLGNQI